MDVISLRIDNETRAAIQRLADRVGNASAAIRRAILEADARAVDNVSTTATKNTEIRVEVRQ